MLGIVFGVLFLIASAIYFIGKLVYKKKVHTDIEILSQASEKLNMPCKVQILRDSSHDTSQIRAWPYAFSLNNGEKQIVSDGSLIEFTTVSKNNALVGYGRGDFGGVSKHPAIDSPFRFDAIDGGTIKLISKPTWDYNGGNGKWKSNLSYNK